MSAQQPPESAPSAEGSERTGFLWRLSDRFVAVSVWWLALTSIVIFAAFAATVLPEQAERTESFSNGAQAPDTSLYYSADDLREVAEAYGPDGRDEYVTDRYTFDVAWPIVYLFFLTTTVSWLLSSRLGRRNRWRLLNLLPLLAFLFDIAENVSVSVVLSRYPDSTPVLADVAFVFTAAKWVTINLAFVALVAGIVVTIRQKLTGRGSAAV
jgi:hypothetical protein